MTGSSLAVAHLDLRLGALHRALFAAARRLQDRAGRDGAAAALDRVDRRLTAPVAPEPAMGAADLDAEETLRAHARAADTTLPLDALAEHFGLTELDRQALIAVVAPELDRAYEPLYAHVCEEPDRRYPAVDLLVTLTAGLTDRGAQRVALGPRGTLRRCGLLRDYGEAPTDLRQQLRLGPGVLDVVLGATDDVALVGRGPFPPCAAPAAPPSARHDVARLARAMCAGDVEVVAVRGRPADAGALVAALGAAVGRRVHPIRLAGASEPRTEADVVAFVRAELLGAAIAVDLPWLVVDDDEPAPPALVEVLAASRIPLAISSTGPWRPVALLARRPWAEIRATADDVAVRTEGWLGRHPDLEPGRARDLALRHPVDLATASAASRVATTSAAIEDRPVRADDLERACVALTTPSGNRLVSVVEPHRGPADLVLPLPVRRQVLELAAFARHLPAITAGTNGHGPGPHGLKALFTGDPGTGKTLAAEVIAHRLGVPLLVADLSRVVSKWVGETAKHLDDVFDVARGSSAVLFFDEADALFGKRGEVRHGTDRYANTEVSHLLQRFETHRGVVVLASNLREQIDPAFVRRFQEVVHFPRPSPTERRRLWELSLPDDRPGSDDLERLAALDLTGAGIVGAARRARLLAAVAGHGLAASHLAQGVARQFRSEGRLAPPADLAALDPAAAAG